MDGYGKLWNDNYCYHGNFKNNKFEGIGILKYTGNGNDLGSSFVTFYKGHFLRNKKNGEGHEIYKNKDFYKGTFHNDLRHGKGTLFNMNGEPKIESSWELGRSVNNSNITEYYANGCLEYRGEFNGVHRHGKGVLCNKSGMIIFDGILEDGIKKEGKLFSNNFIIFQGSFKDGFPNEGTFYHDNGIKLCSATVVDNENDDVLKKYNLVGKTDVKDPNGNNTFVGELILNPNPELNNTENHEKLISNYIDIEVDKEGNKKRYWYTYGTGTNYFSTSTPSRKFTIDKTTLKYDSKYITYWDNGKTKEEFNFKNNLLDGIQKTYFSNGKLNLESRYDNGKKDGYSFDYQDDLLNSIKRKILYQKDLPKSMLLYYDNSKKFYEGDVDNNLRYSGNGTLYYDNDNNSINYCGCFSANKFNGDGVLYHPNGNKSYEGPFNLGRKNGYGTSYYESTATIEYTGDWVNDEKHGEGSLFTESGEIVYNGHFHYDDMSFGNN
jgi:antitoxin component YwqK of YwqJK toxin-antitoxin module